MLTRLYIINLCMVILWSLSIFMTLFTEDMELKILFTKARQLTNPFLTINWFFVFILIFFRGHWKKLKKVAILFYILPVISCISTIFSMSGSLYFEKLMAHSFAPIPGVGLVEYKIGPLLSLQFAFSGLVMLTMMVLFVLLLFSKNTRSRQLARLFFICALIQVALEFYSRSRFGNSAMIQFTVASYTPMLFALYYAIHKLEFLNIKSFSNQVAFENLPTPVITINPRGEIWDANKKALELFQLTTDDLGSTVSIDHRFDFIQRRDQTLRLGENEYLIDYQNLGMGVIVSLTDISQISELNQELAESNEILKNMNVEILKMTNFNKRIQAVLSHDLSGLLHQMNSSLEVIFQNLAIPSSFKNLTESILKTNQSSLSLLKNILSWSYDEEKTELSIDSLLNEIVHSQEMLLKQHQVKLSVINHSPNSTYTTSLRALETILRNLVSNAIKNTPQNLSVLIEVEVKDKLEINIIDQGPGIPQPVLQNLQDETRMTVKSSYGFGIGLQLTFDLIKQLEGTIHFESLPLKGTKVILKI
nr:ATP-binding protein [Bacteriovorax sp. HI3]